MNTDSPEWLANAKRMPVAFAQVREDSLLDLALLDRFETNNLRGIMIASGGCTAAGLAASGRLAQLHLVDANASQIALCTLKLHLLRTAEPLRRMQLMGHAPMQQRSADLKTILRSLDLPDDILGPLEFGPDYSGRYELLFEHLRAEMSSFAEAWESLLNLPDAKDRIPIISPGAPLGRAMDDAFARTMALPNLVQLFSAQATQNSVEAFSTHFAKRTRHAIATLPTADNPYLWQLLLGRFPERVAYPWLEAQPPKKMPDFVYSVGTMDRVLSEYSGKFDFVHLSNILDWLSESEANRTLQLAHDALRPGGYVWLRQLNSTLDPQALGAKFIWHNEEADALHSRDRSFFYRRLHLGRKR